MREHTVCEVLAGLQRTDCPQSVICGFFTMQFTTQSGAVEGRGRPYHNFWRLYRFYEQQNRRVIVAVKAESTCLHTQYLQRYSDANSCIPILSSNLSWPYYKAGTLPLVWESTGKCNM